MKIEKPTNKKLNIKTNIEIKYKNTDDLVRQNLTSFFTSFKLKKIYFYNLKKIKTKNRKKLNIQNKKYKYRKKIKILKRYKN